MWLGYRASCFSYIIEEIECERVSGCLMVPVLLLCAALEPHIQPTNSRSALEGDSLSTVWGQQMTYSGWGTGGLLLGSGCLPLFYMSVYKYMREWKWTVCECLQYNKQNTFDFHAW